LGLRARKRPDPGDDRSPRQTAINRIPFFPARFYRSQSVAAGSSTLQSRTWHDRVPIISVTSPI
jgi:hypothetical protein